MEVKQRPGPLQQRQSTANKQATTWQQQFKWQRNCQLNESDNNENPKYLPHLPAYSLPAPQCH